MLSNRAIGKDSWESFGLQGDQTSQSSGKSTLNIHWKDWCWSWNSNTLATWCEEPHHWKRPWSWERLKAKGEGGSRGWDGWIPSLTQRIRIWANSGTQWNTEQRVGPDLVNEPQEELSKSLVMWAHILLLLLSQRRMTFLGSARNGGEGWAEEFSVLFSG